MKVVVTGGTGLIGAALVDNLIAAGHDVTVLTRIASSATPVLVRWDAKSDGDWMSKVDGSDAVINLAGESLGAKRWTPGQKERILSSRVDATRAIVRAIAVARRKPSVLVSASAVGYYGSVVDGEVAEDHPPGNDFLAEVCRAWEREADQAAAHGVRVVRTRFSFVVGHSAEALRRMSLPFRLFAGGWLGNGAQWFPWIHLNDLVEAVKTAVRTPAITGGINLASPEPLTNKDFCKTLGRVLHRPCWAPAPGFALRMALGEMSTMVLTGQKVVPRKLLENGFKFRFPTLEAALSDVFASTSTPHE
jgi:uncharacterized protein (TIGR01777 family)